MESDPGSKLKYDEGVVENYLINLQSFMGDDHCQLQGFNSPWDISKRCDVEFSLKGFKMSSSFESTNMGQAWCRGMCSAFFLPFSAKMRIFCAFFALGFWERWHFFCAYFGERSYWLGSPLGQIL